MRCAAVLLFVATSCGARTELIERDAVIDAASATPGCPRKSPPDGSRCHAEPGTANLFACYYFVSDDHCSNAAREFVCDSSGTFRASGGCEGLFSEDLCAPDASCLFFGREPRGVPSSAACVVECDRACRCDPTTGKLLCTPAQCT